MRRKGNDVDSNVTSKWCRKCCEHPDASNHYLITAGRRCSLHVCVIDSALWQSVMHAHIRARFTLSRVSLHICLTCHNSVGIPLIRFSSSSFSLNKEQSLLSLLQYLPFSRLFYAPSIPSSQYYSSRVSWSSYHISWQYSSGHNISSIVAWRGYITCCR